MNYESKVLPLIALRGMSMFPGMGIQIDIGRKRSINALNEIVTGDKMAFFVTQKDDDLEEPEIDDLYTYGCIGRVKQVHNLPGSDTLRVIIECLSRAQIVSMVDQKRYPRVLVNVAEDLPFEYNNELEALMRIIKKDYEELGHFTHSITPDLILAVTLMNDPGKLSFAVADTTLRDCHKRQELLEILHPTYRLERLAEMLVHELEVQRMEIEVKNKVNRRIEKVQKEYYLNEQMKVIRDELGDGEDSTALQKTIEALPVDDQIKAKCMKEVDRMGKMPQGSPDIAVIRNWLDWVTELPWKEATLDAINLKKAASILDADHYGLEKVKERIIEYLAVKSVVGSMKGPILCFVGPPGVGKTSIARSIASAVNRKFVRMSLGGVRDEAEIRGHRRTYIGAIPGRIISNIKTAGVNNPLFLFDEIDKLGNDFRGDPASALLEVLDPEQNSTFTDHYLDIPYDLSNVMFVTTANTLESIPEPLMDRMEIIRIAGYTDQEKLMIAKRHLIPKQRAEHGLKANQLVVRDTAILDMIHNYTREAGVRGLERQIGSLCRKAIRTIMDGKGERIVVSSKNLEKYLGSDHYKPSEMSHKDEIGVANGLAWTSVGGVTLSVEVNVMQGSGNLELTGQLGDVMKESARTAYSYIRAHADEWGIDQDFYKEKDVHIHIPAGATPKDGPSAGITLTTAMVSALSERPVRGNVAMTGEITLRGKVLPIGGLKEKALAAYREHINTVLIPKDNTADIDEIPKEIRDKINFIPVTEIGQVLECALQKEIVCGS